MDDTNTELVQQDLVNLFNWSEDWQMLFNIDKCIVLHMGCKIQTLRYELGGRELKSVEQEHQNGKTSAQCTIAANKANQMLVMIRRNIEWKNQKVIVRLYKALVRPRIEYCVQAWSPNLEKDKLLLEKVQRRAIKMNEGFGNSSYNERLRSTGLTASEERRIRGDLIETFRMVEGISQIEITQSVQYIREHQNEEKLL